MMSLRVGLVNLATGDELQKVAAAIAHTEKRLYVSIPLCDKESMVSMQKRLSAVYHVAQGAAPNVDTLVLLAKYCPPDVGGLLGYEDEEGDAALAKAYGLPLKAVPRQGADGSKAALEAPEAAEWKRYEHVCMGGTFDKLHIGQKLLLSLALLTCAPSGRFFCGIAGDKLFEQKVLRELIDPYGIRERTVIHFLTTISGVGFPDAKSTRAIQTAELVDRYGPSVKDPAFQAIVVSEETRAGGDACNDERRNRGLAEMDVVVVGLVDSTGALSAKPITATQKLSSTAKRERIVGQLLNGDELWCRRDSSRRAYAVGLTGGIATGKTTICEFLASKGAVEIVNADKLGHDAYAPGTPGCAAVLEAFPSVRNEQGEVDRAKLGAVVFSDKAEMKRLTDIVWPIIKDRVVGRVNASTAEVVVVEAAILVEAGWVDLFDEVWVSVVPPAVARQRLMARNNLSEAEADKRLASQMSSVARTAAAHVLLSNHGERAGLEAQLVQAWEALEARRGVKFDELEGLAAVWREHAAGGDLAYWWRELRDRYTARGRCYHTLQHLEEMFTLFGEAELENPRRVAAAIFFHDAVYDATAPPAQNEKDSAVMWERYARSCGGAYTEDDIAAVSAYIVRTATHMAGPAEGDLAAFLDIDLAVLGRAPAEYAEYAEAISREYHHIPYEKFCTARAAAMNSFAANPEGPYFTPWMRERRGAAAIANVADEMGRLGAQAAVISRVA
eukprot:TRINITY_DN1804_c0_g1_i1.p1 TRINITY_DN1804_c0_g1~~TRINITY_DN1804_c0_g1_i1.p1  ORF type:complete len:728 (+),score=298.71 TRINITY_DN1804_c0_g1_i1:45-2228(+)